MIRILVVEDDRDISALIQLALKNAGYDVFAAFDGQEGANLLETQKFDLCLLDIMRRRSADTNCFHILMSIQYR